MRDATTIQLDRKLKSKLDIIMRETGMKTYAAAIDWLTKKAKSYGPSEFGKFPKLKTFKREKHDRFD